MRVLDAFPDRKYFPGFDMVVLDFGKLKETDNSPAVYRVPTGLLKEDAIAEIIVRRAKITTDPMYFLVAVRPFDRQTYGKPFKWAEADFGNMFGYNMKDSDHSRMFYKKFIKS
jgi:hypothetical protein